MIEESGDLRYDLIFEGGKSHAWITELGCCEDDGAFAKFVERTLANMCEYKDMTVSYESGEKAFNVKYNEHFAVNEQKIDTEYARFENDYVNGKVERKSDVIEISFAGKSLMLNFNEGVRAE